MHQNGAVVLVAEPIRILLVDDDEDDYLMTRDLILDIPRNKFEIDWVATYDSGLQEDVDGRVELAELPKSTRIRCRCVSSSRTSSGTP